MGDFLRTDDLGVVRSYTDSELKDRLEQCDRAIANMQGPNRPQNFRDQLIELQAVKAALLAEQELRQPGPALTVPRDGPLGGGFGGGSMVRAAGAYDLRGPGQSKQWADLFGTDGLRWEDKDSNFFSAVFSGRHHPGLIRASMTETVPSDGGFLVPSEQAAKIHAVSLENEIVQPRCYVQPMKSNSIKIPAMAIGSHASALMGGFTASYTSELGTISEADPKARSMELNAKKLTGLIRFSAELDADTPGGMSQIEVLCGRGLAWYRDKAFLKGTGAGEPLGILNASCVVEVAPEGGQGSTIIYENLTKMMSRMFAGSFRNSVWVAHQSTIPQLLSLAVPIGLGGTYIPVMQESNGEFKILTRPVLFTEKTEPLGTKGDIMLADFSQYVVGLRSEMRFETSIHVAFTTDELLSRIIERHDGQPLWDEALTLADGTTTVSPFVVLGAR
jgi:HK97 family phage major capsid protein